jgi:hypothetical protein
MVSVLNIIIIFLKIKEKIPGASRIYSMYEKEYLNNVPLYEYLEKCLLEI